MTILPKGAGPFFGMAEDETLPVLPEGFTFIKSPMYWLLATDGRKRYYVTKAALCQQIKARPNRKVKASRRRGMWVYKDRGIFKGLNYRHVFIDNRKTIPLE